MKRFTSLAALLLTSASLSYAAPYNKVQCVLEDDQNGIQVIDLIFKSSTKVAASLTVNIDGTDQKVDLPAQYGLITAKIVNVEVGYIMGSLNFALPMNLPSKKTNVKVTGYSEGSVSESIAVCRTL